MIKEGGGGEQAEIVVPLGEAAGTFDLERTVCSHGMFMMAPNHWDPFTRTFSRPLRLCPHSKSYEVSISQPSDTRHFLVARVRGTCFLPDEQRVSLLRQIVRMLRLSEEDEKVAREFRKIAEAANGDSALWLGGFGGRVFRSPTLFEDMVKCILLCNCQWSRTLNMAKSLCDLQLELQSKTSPVESPLMKDDFAPKTPTKKRLKRKLDDDDNLMTEFCRDDLLGNFPIPEELSNLDEKFLAKRCNVGYRASRIINLAKEILQGNIPLKELEEIENGSSIANYENLVNKLQKIDGFGPFTCANVLMCMGFYHVIPTDSETVRHLKQVHGKVCNIKTVQTAVKDIYGNYDPFQFLAYWAEIWFFYEQRFGKLSELTCADYSQITASNMRTKVLTNRSN